MKLHGQGTWNLLFLFVIIVARALAVLMMVLQLTSLSCIVIVAGKNNMNFQGKDNVEKWRRTAFFLSMAVMLGGLLFSRALLSSGLIFFVAISLFHKNIVQQLKAFFTSPFLW